MKRRLLFFAILFLAMNVNAQSGFSLSAFGGVNGSGVKIKEDVFNMQGYTDMNAGFAAGVKVQYEFRKPLLVEVQSFYNRCSYGITVPNTNMMEHVDFYMDFISVPVLVGYNFYLGEKESFSISPKVGIVPSFFVNSFARFEKEKYDTKVDNKVDWRAMLELEFSWKINNLISVFMNVDGRAGWGIITYSNISDFVDNYSAPGVRNYVLSGNVGVKFKLTNREQEVYEFY